MDLPQKQKWPFSFGIPEIIQLLGSQEKIKCEDNVILTFPPGKSWIFSVGICSNSKMS